MLETFSSRMRNKKPGFLSTLGIDDSSNTYTPNSLVAKPTEQPGVMPGDPTMQTPNVAADTKQGIFRDRFRSNLLRNRPPSNIGDLSYGRR